MISKSKSMNNINKLENKKMIVKSNSYNDVVSANTFASNTTEIIKHIPYVSFKNISKCLVSEIFPQSLLENEKSNETLDLAICLAEPEPDIYDFCLSKNSTECPINRGTAYRTRRNEQDEFEDTNRQP